MSRLQSLVKDYRFFVLSLLFLLVFAIRMHDFGQIPDGVNRDEASIGYTAFLLLHTGMDEHGQRWPWRFESFGDWKRPLYVYLSIPIIWLMGLSPVSIRLLNLMAAMVMIYAAFKIEGKLHTSTSRSFWGNLALIVLLGLNPWHFHFSRFAVEPLLAAAFFTVSLWFLLRNTHVKAVTIGILLLLCSFFSYHAALVFIPLWFAGYLWLYRDRLFKNRLVLVPIIVFYLVIGFTFLQAWNSAERVKATGTTIFTMSVDEQWQKIYQYRNDSVWPKLTHNQFSYYLQTFISNYLRSFTPEFLWLKGGNHTHYNIPGFGNFFVAEVVLATIGVLMVVVKKNRKASVLILAILLAPIPAALTKDGAHSTREIFFIPSFQLLAAYGFGILLNRIRKREHAVALAGIFGVLLAWQAIPFFATYFGPYRLESNTRFSGYMNDISVDLVTFNQEYPRIYITYPFESPYIFYAFYTVMEPHSFLNTIIYAPIDALGFKHAQSLGKMHYIKDKGELLGLSEAELNGALVLSRVGEITGAVPIKVYYDALGQKQIEALPGSSIINIRQ